jgi:hypothetical protein
MSAAAARRRAAAAAAATLALAFAALPAASPAQALLDRSVRTGPQVVSYRVDAADERTITQFAFPIAIAIPLFNRLSVDVATAYARVTYDSASFTGKIDGLTDTQLRASYTLGTDNVVFTMGLNLPTGQETVDFATQGAAAGQIGNDFLAFPISNMGTGFAGTGGIALARTAGSWNVGAGVSFRRTMEFEPFEESSLPGGTGRVRFQPGDEYRIRAGVDRAVGSGSLALGVTYFKFGDDDIAATTYSSGDRVLGQAGFVRPMGGTTLALAAWNLYRMKGELAIGEDAPTENIANVGATLGFRMGRTSLEPNAEYRRWTVDGESAGNLGLFGVRARLDAGRFAFVPSVAMATGSLTPLGATESDGLSGWRGTFTVQYR